MQPSLALGLSEDDVSTSREAHAQREVYMVAGRGSAVHYCTIALGRVTPPVASEQRHGSPRSYRRVASSRALLSSSSSTLLPLPLLIGDKFPASIFSSFISLRNRVVCFDVNEYINNYYVLC
jgi:hypothetical protein